jgi:pyruvate ferredoxin oxidoreductase gamma subunit
MDELIEIRWHGRGGQGVVTAGKLLAETALGTGLYFQAFPDFGPERMGAPIRSFTRLSPKPITIHSQIEQPDVVLVLDPTLLGILAVTEGLKEKGTLVVNTSMSPAEVREVTGFHTGQTFTVDASHIAIEEMGRDITNCSGTCFWRLGTLRRDGGIWTHEWGFYRTRRRRLRPLLTLRMIPGKA